jgi:hypothetical protein
VIAAPNGTPLELDGAPVDALPVPIDQTGFSVVRVALDASAGGVHTLRATAPVEVQVMGYGNATSYQYPGGLDLEPISPPPVK